MRSSRVVSGSVSLLQHLKIIIAIDDVDDGDDDDDNRCAFN